MTLTPRQHELKKSRCIAIGAPIILEEAGTARTEARS